MDYLELYSDFLKKFLKPKRKLKVVFDCSNGTTGIILKKLFRQPDVKPQVSVVLINDNPDGSFPAHGPNPLIKGATKQLEKAVKEEKADLGVIFDSDGDRAFFVDGLGRLIDGDAVTKLLIEELNPKNIVVDINTGWLIKKSKVIISRTGTYFIKEAMGKYKANLGAERSGHYYFSSGKNKFYFDSGILAAIHMINHISKMKSEEFYAYLGNLEKYCRFSEDFIVSEKNKKKILNLIIRKYGKSAEKISKLDGITIEFEKWWYNVRPSNTEDLLRLNIETIDKKMLKKKLREIKKLIV